ncbi:MAG: DNA translocase FtsK 4TM domain-containing protein, partial [candidate division Zixibacteria bacterium]|nr:DNA translocase FtsK 4TM domain-containing protein [candidate division Zixibacteria bacterium]
MSRTRSVAAARKEEILGFLLIVLAVFLLISLATHNRQDYGLFSNVVTWTDFFHLDIKNAAGLLGTVASQGILWAAGRSTFLLPLLMILAGWHYLFKFNVSGLRNKLLLTLLLVFALGTLIMLLNLDKSDVAANLTGSLSGTLGFYLAGLLRTLIGVTGGFALLAAVMVVCFFSVVPYRPRNIRQHILKFV